MSPHRLALRNLLGARPRMLAASVLVAGGVCVLDLFAGHVASEQSRLEYHAVVGEGLGHLAIVRKAGAFDAGEAASARHIAESMHGVSLVVPQVQADRPEVERMVVYLSKPSELEAVRSALLEALRRGGIAAEVRSWRELSAAYASTRRSGHIELLFLAASVLGVIAATIGATLSINRIERRRELATLRALGMRPRAVFVHLMTEALLIAGLGVMLGVITSGLAAWLLNLIALSYAAQPSLARPPVLVEPDLGRILLATATVLVVALLAALIPATKAARADVARGLAGIGAEGW